MKSNIDAIDPRAWPEPRYLDVTVPHRIAFRVIGRPAGDPWLLLHGGPGSGASRAMLQPLDLTRHRAVLPDQRGSGDSLPRGRVLRNHTAALVADIEALRQHLGIERWSVLAGSWGAALALAYGGRHPQCVQRVVLRGAFALGRGEIGRLLKGRHSGKVPSLPSSVWPRDGGVPVTVLLRRLRQVFQSVTPGVAALGAARRWAVLEARAAERGLWRALWQASPSVSWASRRQAWAVQRRSTRRLFAQAQCGASQCRPADRQRLRKFKVQAHYLFHRGFLRPAALDQALLGLARAGVPVDWVHGRCDSVCPPLNSQRAFAMFLRRGGHGRLWFTAAGHLGHEPAQQAALCQAVQT